MSFMTETIRDCLTIGGAVGAVLTLAGVLVALVQLWRTKTAAEATRAIAGETLDTMRQQYNRYAGANANRFYHEVEIHIANRSWGYAALRLGDLADQAAQMAQVVAAGGEELRKLAADLRGWANNLRSLGVDSVMKPTQQKKWRSFSRDLSLRLDTYYGPFAPLAKDGES